MRGDPTVEDQQSAGQAEVKPRLTLARTTTNWVLLSLAVIAMLSFFGLGEQSQGHGEPLSLRAIQSDAPIGARESVAAQIMNMPVATGTSSDLGNRPLWLRTTVQAALNGSERLLHVPAVGLGRVDFVIRDQQEQVLTEGSAGRYGQLVNAEHAYPGFKVAIPSGLEFGTLEILMRVEPLTLTSVQIYLWDAASFEQWQISNVQRNVLVLGALLFLAIYAFTAAITSRRYEFSLLGAWLLARCSMLVMDSGIGASGFKTVEPLFQGAAIEQWLTVCLPFTTLLLTRAMLTQTIANSPLKRAVTPLLCAFAILFGLSPFLPVWIFQLSYWLLGASLLAALVSFGVSAWQHRTDHAGRWFVLGALCDGVGAVFALLQDLGAADAAINNWFANDQMSLAAAVLAGLAVGQRLNSEREQRKLSQQRALNALEKYQAVYRSVPTALVSVADGDRVVRYNEGFARLFELPSDDIGDTSDPAALAKAELDDSFPQDLRARIREELNDKVECDFDHQIKNGVGIRWLRIMARGSSAAYEASFTDISDQKAVERHLEMVAEHDALTSALNRLGLTKHLQTLIDSHDSDEISHTAICYVDLDRFKMLNDLFGHHAGDAVLCEVVTRLQNSLGRHNLVARLGGDEFVIVLGAADQSVHEGLAWRALEAITNQAFQFDGKSFAVTASIGVFRLLPGLAQADLIASADRACQDAKRRGRNQVVICEDSSALVRQRQWELSLVARLNDPKTFEEFELVAQPIIGLHGSSRLSCELLLRHRGEDDSLVPAAALIAAAETNGEMAAIDRWVLERALAWLSENQEKVRQLDYVSINLSGSSLNDEFFKTYVLALLSRYRSVAAHVVLEVTETVATQDVFMTCQFAEAVRKLGARIALDDFGSGYSNFSSLASMPASFIKIDGRFVRSIREDGNGLNIVRTISLLAHELQMVCIAEWVEDIETLRMLRSVGVDQAQGHVVARPIDLVRLLELIDAPEALIDSNVVKTLSLPITADLDSMSSLARKIHGSHEAVEKRSIIDEANDFLAC